MILNTISSIAVQIDLQKFLNYLLLSLAVTGGIITGILAGRLIDLSLGGEAMSLADPAPREMAVQQLQEDDFQIILDRNLFNSEDPAGTAQQVDLSATAIAAASTRSSGNFILVGTIVAGEDSFALIKSGSKTGIFQLGEELAPGVVVSEIGRKLVVLMDHGVRKELPLKQRKGAGAKLVRQKNPAASKRGIVAVDENSYLLRVGGTVAKPIVR